MFLLLSSLRLLWPLSPHAFHIWLFVHDLQWLWVCGYTGHYLLCPVVIVQRLLHVKDFNPQQHGGLLESLARCCPLVAMMEVYEIPGVLAPSAVSC